MNSKKLTEQKYTHSVNVQYYDDLYKFRFYEYDNNISVQYLCDDVWMTIVTYTKLLPHYVQYIRHDKPTVSSAKMIAYALLQDTYDKRDNAFSKMLSKTKIENFKEDL